eukprot:c20944_g1_i2 orf=603-1397(+)
MGKMVSQCHGLDSKVILWLFHHQMVQVGFSGPLNQTVVIVSIWTEHKCFSEKLSSDFSAVFLFLKRLSTKCRVVPVLPMTGSHNSLLQWKSVWEHLAEICVLILPLRRAFAILGVLFMAEVAVRSSEAVRCDEESYLPQNAGSLRRSKYILSFRLVKVRFPVIVLHKLPCPCINNRVTFKHGNKGYNSSVMLFRGERWRLQILRWKIIVILLKIGTMWLGCVKRLLDRNAINIELEHISREAGSGVDGHTNLILNLEKGGACVW